MIDYSVLEKVIQAAVTEGMKSPCQSKRGVVIFSRIGQILSRGYNHQPIPFVCDGSSQCKQNCGRTAIHAEQSAILKALKGHYDVTVASMLHVKAKDGMPMAGGPPSCLECSKLILEAGIDRMMLLNLPQAQMLPESRTEGIIRGFIDQNTVGDIEVRSYSAAQFHRLTAECWHRISLRT